MRDQYCHLDGEPHAAEDLPCVHDPQELVLSGGLEDHNHHQQQQNHLHPHLVEERDLLVDEESVGHPDELDVLGPHH